MGLQRVTSGYKGLKAVTRDHRRFKGFQELKGVYKG